MVGLGILPGEGSFSPPSLAGKGAGGIGFLILVPESYMIDKPGEVAEWSIASDLKSDEPLRVPGVRISPSPS